VHRYPRCGAARGPAGCAVRPERRAGDQRRELRGDRAHRHAGLDAGHPRRASTRGDRSRASPRGGRQARFPGGFTDISPAGRGLQAVLCLLDEQLRRCRKRRVPSVDEDSAWTVRVTGADRLSPRAEESLFTLGAAGFATRGSVEEPTGQSVPLTLAAGAYLGSGPGQHLLPGPRWTGLDIEPAPGGDLRMLDLRTGVLFREEESGNGPPMRSLRFASLTLPGVVALRAEASVGRLRAGSPLQPPRDARMTQGRMRDWHWARVGGDGGPGIAAVAWQRLGRDGDTRTVERVAAY